MNKQQLTSITAVIALTISISACTVRSNVEHYVSPRIQGESKLINLDEVQKAFWETKAPDFNSWMAAFEKRVNEIYEGKSVVAIDANRETGKLVVTGFIDKDEKEGYQAGDEKLFSIEQTGEAVNNEVPYRVAGGDGRTYYEGHRSILDNPILQMMLISHMMGGWGGRYYTPYTRTVVLTQHRDAFRNSASFTQQKSANTGFFSRFKGSDSSIKSSSSFGSSSFSSNGTQKRSWFGGSSSGSSGGSSSIWGGRRSGSFGGLGGGRGWGGRRGR
jgi:hypothetical protein